MARIREGSRRIRGRKRKVLLINGRVRVRGFDNTTDKTARKKGLKRKKGFRNNPDFRIKKIRKGKTRVSSRINRKFKKRSKKNNTGFFPFN